MPLQIATIMRFSHLLFGNIMIYMKIYGKQLPFILLKFTESVKQVFSNCYYFGQRKLEIMHTRLRINCSALNKDLFSRNTVASPLCMVTVLKIL